MTDAQYTGIIFAIIASGGLFQTYPVFGICFLLGLMLIGITK